MIQTPDRKQISPRAQLEKTARKLAQPILELSSRETGLLGMPVAPSNTERRQFAPLEALGRLYCGLGPWMEYQSRSQQEDKCFDVSAAQKLLSISLRPGPAQLDFSSGKQPLVDAAFLAQSILRAPTVFWEDMGSEFQSDLVDALLKTRNIKPFFNNWILFQAIIEALFLRIGAEWDRTRIDYALRQHAAWYVGDSFYSDGPNFRQDYYNSFVIQPMLIDILNAVKGQYKEWDSMALKVNARAERHATFLEKLIASDGSFPPIGRSISYRCGAFHLLAQLAWNCDLPSNLPRGQVRGALLAVIERTLGSDRNFDPDGWLVIGINSSQPKLGEYYITTGSLYLCSTAFLPLGLGPTDRFWTDLPQPWTQRRLWLRSEDIPADVALDGT